MSPNGTFQLAWPLRFPRVSGDEPEPMVVMGGRFQFSPRERG